MREITFDTETTGLDPKSGHRVIEIGCVELIDKMRTGKHFHAYINPKRDVPKSSTDVHGLTAGFLSDKPVFEEIADEFLEFIGNDQLVIHNASFDLKFINSELKAVRRELIEFERALDTLSIARVKFPGAKVNLDALCNRYGIDLSKREKHGALLDAELLADVYLELIGGKQGAMDLDSGSKEIAAILSGQRKYRKPREFRVTNEEISAHEEFMKRING